MLTKTTLAKMQALSERQDKTLTAYLDIDQNDPSNRKRGYLVRGEALLKELRAAAPDEEELAAAVERAMELLENLAPQGKTALVVVNTAAGVAEVAQLKVALPQGAWWKVGAHLRPLLEAMDEYERYAVVLTDKKRARIFTIYMGEITEHEDLWSPTEGKIAGTAKDERWSQARRQRHHEQQVALHAKRVVDALQELSQRLRFDRLIVAGPTEAASTVAKLLPKRLHGKLVETIPLSISASPQEVLEKVRAVQERMERAHELEMIEALASELHESGKAVSGLETVCRAVSETRVWRLFYVRGYHATGVECTACGALSPGTPESCPVCGGAVRPTEQLVDRLSQAVLEQAGQVEVVAGPAAERLEKLGSIAALLRY
jgi:peptide chain release factor subunit 1